LFRAIANSQILANFTFQEPVTLAQQLIRIPSFLWHVSEIGFWIAGWLRSRNFDVEVQEAPLRSGGVTHQAIGRLRGGGDLYRAEI
jgi:hypothetical protein